MILPAIRVESVTKPLAQFTKVRVLTADVSTRVIRRAQQQQHTRTYNDQNATLDFFAPPFTLRSITIIV